MAIKNSADDAPYLFILTINDAKGKTATIADDYHDELIDVAFADSAYLYMTIVSLGIHHRYLIDKISGSNLDYPLDSAQFYAKTAASMRPPKALYISIGIIPGSIDVERPKEDYGYYPVSLISMKI